MTAYCSDHENARKTAAAAMTADSERPGSMTDRDNADQPGASPASGDEADRVLLELLVQLSLRMRVRGVDLESASGLSGRELDLIALLAASGPTSIKSLVADLGLPRSTMTAIVDRLEFRGLVLRHPNPTDRRSVVLESTARAVDALVRYRQGVSGLVEHVKKVLSPEERESLTRSIEKLAATL